MSDSDMPLASLAPSPRQETVLRLWKRIKQLQGMKVDLENALLLLVTSQLTSQHQQLRVELNKETKSNVRGSLQVEVVVREILQRVAGMSNSNPGDTLGHEGASGDAAFLCEQPVSVEGEVPEANDPFVRQGDSPAPATVRPPRVKRALSAPRCETPKRGKDYGKQCDGVLLCGRRCPVVHSCMGSAKLKESVGSRSEALNRPDDDGKVWHRCVWSKYRYCATVAVVDVEN